MVYSYCVERTIGELTLKREQYHCNVQSLIDERMILIIWIMIIQMTGYS